MKDNFVIYWLISEDKSKTYVGFTNNLHMRVLEHRSKKVKTTKIFGNFEVNVLEVVDNIYLARIREKYWKSHAGRKKLKKLFENKIG